AADAQILVDDLDPLRRPAEGDGPIREGVLTGRGLAMVGDLLGGGLADVDDRLAVEVPGLELGRSGGVSHGRPPRGAWPRADVRAAGRGVRGGGAAGPPAAAGGGW